MAIILDAYIWKDMHSAHPLPAIPLSVIQQLWKQSFARHRPTRGVWAPRLILKNCTLSPRANIMLVVNAVSVDASQTVLITGASTISNLTIIWIIFRDHAACKCKWLFWDIPLSLHKPKITSTVYDCAKLRYRLCNRSSRSGMSDPRCHLLELFQLDFIGWPDICNLIYTNKIWSQRKFYIQKCVSLQQNLFCDKQRKFDTKYVKKLYTIIN